MNRNMEMSYDAQIDYRDNYTKVSHLYAVIVIIGLFCSIISMIIIIHMGKGSEYFLFFLLPVGFSFFLIMTSFCDHNIYESTVFLIFVGLYFLKLVVTPALSAIGDWYTLAEDTVYGDYLTHAIFLTIWEPLFVGTAMIVYTRRRRRSNQFKSTFFRDIFMKDFKYRFDGADLIIVVGVLFIIGTLLYYPPLRVRLEWILNITSNQNEVPIVRSWRNFSAANGREMPLGIIDTLMMKVFYVVRVLFPVMLIEKVYRTKWGWRKKVFTSLLIVLTAAQITTEANKETVLCVISLVLLIFALYPRFQKKYAKVVIIVGMLAVGTLFALKVSGDVGYIKNSVNIAQSISATMNAYMNGPINLAIAIKAKHNYNIFMGIEEVLGGLPFLSRFFQGYQTSIIFNEAFWGFKGRADQLLPSLGQGYMYFGSILAPTLQFLFIIWGMKFEDISKGVESIKVKGYFIFLSVVMIWTVGNNLSHVMTAMVQYLPGIIILYFMKYKVKIKS